MTSETLGPRRTSRTKCPPPNRKLRDSRNIVIIGGGIIGCTTAYYITRHPKFDSNIHTVTILEATAIASNASGKAGGLLANWAYPSCLAPLSFRLHQQLAAEHDGANRWGYRMLEKCGTVFADVRSADPEAQASKFEPSEAAKEHARSDDLPIEPTMSNQTCKSLQKAAIDADFKADKRKSSKPKTEKKSTPTNLMQHSALPTELEGLIERRFVYEYQQMRHCDGRECQVETAQVHPFQFTNAVAELATKGGVHIRLKSKVTKVSSTKNRLHYVEYEDRETGTSQRIEDVTDVVVAAGPWSAKILPECNIEPVRFHSVVFEAHVKYPCAVFTRIQVPKDWIPDHRARKGQAGMHEGQLDPEMYARPFGEVYVCGGFDEEPLPDTADLVQCDEDECDDLVAYIGTVSPLGQAPVKTKQACYMPVHTFSGEQQVPLVGSTSVPGIWLASGHTCWGIQNGPVTGLLVAEMLLDGRAKSAKITALYPTKWGL